jgi:hypothetical protein
MEICSIKRGPKLIEIFIEMKGKLLEISNRCMWCRESNTMDEDVPHMFMFRKRGIKTQCHHLKFNILMRDSIHNFFNRHLRPPNVLGVIIEGKDKDSFLAVLHPPYGNSLGI